MPSSAGALNFFTPHWISSVAALDERGVEWAKGMCEAKATRPSLGQNCFQIERRVRPCARLDKLRRHGKECNDMGFSDIALQMVVLVVPLVIGFAARKANFMDEKFDAQLTRLVLNVTMPCMIVSSVDSAQLPGVGAVGRILGVSLLAYLVALVASLVLGRLIAGREGNASTWSFIALFGNIGFIGFPVISAIFGTDALVYAVIAALPANLFVFSVGPLLATGAPLDAAGTLRKLAGTLRTTPMIASLVVLLLALLGINDLGVIGDGLAVAGKLTTPAALLVTGSSLAAVAPREMLESPRAALASACRLVVIPLVVCVALGPLLASDQLLRAVTVVSFGMPLATNGVLYCLQAGTDPKPMLQATFITVIGSILTIPVLATLAAL